VRGGCYEEKSLFYYGNGDGESLFGLMKKPERECIIVTFLILRDVTLHECPYMIDPWSLKRRNFTLLRKMRKDIKW